MKEYTYNIIDDVYRWMISRKKDIEVRILKEKSEAIQVGDTIIFNNQDSIGKYVKVKVVDKTVVNNIEELIEKFDVNRMMPGHTNTELIELTNKIYGEEEGKRKFIDTVSKETEEIRKDYIEDNQRGEGKEPEHKSILEDFQL